MSYYGSPEYLTDGRAGSFQFSRDGRSAHEYHGWGTLRPDGGIDFNDYTPWGRHSHTVYDLTIDGTTNYPTFDRPEGFGGGGFGGFGY